MKHLLIFLLLLSFNASFSQTIKLTTVDEIMTTYRAKGTDSALARFGWNIDLYRIDSIAALKIAYSCNSIAEHNRQLKLLADVGSFLKDEKLNHLLVEHLAKYRNVCKSEGIFYLVDENLIKALAFQNDSLSIRDLKLEFSFWKTTADSIKSNLVNPKDKYSSQMYAYGHCQYNYFMIAWCLNKLNVPEFPISKIDQLGAPDITADKVRERNLKIKFSDTLTLSKNYSSLAEIDYLAEPAFDKVYDNFLGKPDSSCSISLVYETSTGIIDFVCWKSERDGHFATYLLKLIAPNKILIAFIHGAVS